MYSMCSTLFRFKINDFHKFPVCKFNINRSFYNTIAGDKFIINKNVVVNIKPINTSLYTFKKYRRLPPNSVFNDSWDHIKKYDYICVNLHDSDLHFINAFINSVNDSKNRNKGLIRRIKKQYNEYITIMNAVNKFGKNYFLFGLNRKAEMSNFASIAMDNRNEIIKLFYLILLHTNDLLNSDVGLQELKRLCPNIYRFIIIKKSNYYLKNLMGFISGLNTKRRVDVLVLVDKYLQAHLSLLFDHIITTSTINKGFNTPATNTFTCGMNSYTTDTSTGAVGSDTGDYLGLDEDLTHMEVVNMRKWSRFMLFYMILPLVATASLIIYGVYRYIYNIKRNRFISITIRDDLSPDLNSDRKRNLKVHKRVHFYNSQRD